jgi:uncharacterized membrane-anchored protein
MSERLEKTVLLSGIGLQMVVLSSMLAMHASTLWLGTVYYVHVQPVDPRDLFRGDYVTLSYAFSRVPSHVIRQNSGTPVYVTLVPAGDGKHSIAGQYLSSPPAGGTPYLKGTVNEFGQAVYGIESFYVQEGKGRAYEDAVRSKRLTAEIAVTSSGQAALRHLHIEPK